jgi:hypothetical protein
VKRSITNLLEGADLSQLTILKLAFIASARLAFNQEEPKKKGFSIGNSYNSIQNAWQIDTAISISLLDAKKIQY